MDNSIIRVKVKTNRFVNLFISIQPNKSIQELSDRIIECFYELDDEDTNEQPKEKNVTVIALNFDGFFISKSENVADILKDGDEIECIFSGSKLRYSGSSFGSEWKGNKWESRRSNNSYNSNSSNKNYRGFKTGESSYELCDKNKRGFDMGKKERKKNKFMEKDKQRKEYLKKEETRDSYMKSRNDYYPFKIQQEHTQIKVEYPPIKFPSFWNDNSDANNKEKDEMQENTGVAEGSEQDNIDGQPENEDKLSEDKNLKLLQNEKQGEDKICDSPQSMTRKEFALENHPNKSSEELSDLRVSLPSKETKFVKEPSITQQSDLNDIIELSSKMSKRKSNKLNKTYSKCVKLEHLEMETTNDDGIGKGVIKEIEEMKNKNKSGHLEQNDKKEKSGSKVRNKKFEKLLPDDNKFEGIIYCYNKEKENEEVSKTFIETESETDSFELTLSIGEQASILKEISKGKHSKSKIKFEEKL